MSDTMLAILQILMAAGFGGFWTYFFLVENHSPGRSEVYLAYERSFPLPDLGWTVPCLVAAAVGVLKGMKFGYVLSIAAGGALVFLGLVDIAFNLRNGQYTSGTANGVLNACVNAACIVTGPLFIIFGARMLTA